VLGKQGEREEGEMRRGEGGRRREEEGGREGDGRAWGWRQFQLLERSSYKPS
jgi:hypothetical protein